MALAVSILSFAVISLGEKEREREREREGERERERERERKRREGWLLNFICVLAVEWLLVFCVSSVL